MLIRFFFALSGVIYQLGLFFVAPSSDFRYSHWLLLVAWYVSVVILLARIGPRLLSVSRQWGVTGSIGHHD